MCHIRTVARKDYPGTIHNCMLLSAPIIFDGVKSRTRQPHLVPFSSRTPTQSGF